MVSICFAILASQAAPAQPAAHLQREIQKIITFDAEIDFKQTPGILVGVVMGDSAYVFSYGSEHLPHETEFFELGELTQVFTAALVVRLGQEGKIDLDERWKTLLNHSSGLPRYPNGPEGEKGRFAFSNLNYDSLQIALEIELAMPFEEILRAGLLDPLGLDSTLFELPPDAVLAQGFNLGGLPAEPAGPEWGPASFGLKSTARDLIRWMRQILAPESDWHVVFSELYRAPVPTGIRKNTWMGYGWHVIYPKKRFRVLAHTGATDGHMAYMAIAPQTRTGVFVLANSPHGVKGLGMLALRMLNNNWKK